MSSPSPTRPTRRGSSLVRRLLVLEIATVVLAAVIAGGVSAWNTRETIERNAADKMVAVAVALASSPGLADAVGARDVPRVQAAAEDTRTGTGVSFVTVMDPAGTRLSHPDPERIGETYQGTFLPAAAGATLVETFPGTLGLSVRAIVPVRAADGAVVGMVAVGQLRVQVADRIARELAILALAAAVAIALGVGLAVVAARRVKRDTLGLEPREITALHRHHEAVMAAMREGLLVLDAASGRVVVLNAEAARLLGLPATVAPSRAAGPTLAELGVDPALQERLADRSPVTDETVLVGERLLLVNRTELSGPSPDVVVTLRDRTELEAMTRELDDARSVTRALRFAAHEHANHLQAVSTLIELGAEDDARELAQRWTRDLLAGSDGELRDRIADPALAALVLDKAADARDRGLELRVGDDTALSDTEAGDEQASTDRVTVVGNLVDNALDAALQSAHAGAGGVVELDVHAAGGSVVIRVADDGPGLADPDAAFTPGWSTKDGDGPPGRRGLGLALVRRVVDRRRGSIEVAAGPDGRGTVFTVTLPVGSVPGPSAQSPVASR
ncbi:ATP-binding protein [Actinomycetospora straminea]|uniref:ATP-binding protein n=1 Tax=Actinomycetospora straminea TaxID=663607 RepID=UPI0023662482|nr:ATP-binding protein [Actinomycetospora straminea]MDD7934945.1 ATP-binding protein [Actinomycetospora straminea]